MRRYPTWIMLTTKLVVTEEGQNGKPDATIIKDDAAGISRCAVVRGPGRACPTPGWRRPRPPTTSPLSQSAGDLQARAVL